MRRVFISHDSRDKELALAFVGMLERYAIRKGKAAIEIFCTALPATQGGIPYGAPWFETIMDELFSADYLVALLTPRSVNRPWVLFEAGVIQGRMKRRAHGVALGVSLKQLKSGPFAQFQGCDSDNASLRDLCWQLTGFKDAPEGFDSEARALRQLAVRPAAPISHGVQIYSTLRPRIVKMWLRNAKKIKILKTWFPDDPEISDGLHAAIQGGRPVDILLSNPYSPVLEARCESARGPGRPYTPGAGHRTVMDALIGIAEVANPQNYNTRVRLFQGWPSVPIIWLDDHMLVGFYLRGRSSPFWPWIELNDSRSQLWKDLSKQIDLLWASASEKLDTLEKLDEYVVVNNWDYAP